MKIVKSILQCLAGVALLAGIAHAQEFTGRVVDSSGAVLPKAKVTVVNQDTNVYTTTVTTASGDFTVPYLRPGIYRVSAARAGFETQTKTDITLQVSQTITVNFAMKVGSVAETVTVTAAALDQSKADVGEVVENERVSQLPLNGGDTAQLAQLSAGTSWSGSLQWVRPFDNTLAVLSINGGGVANNAVLLDGVSNEAAHGDAYNGTNSQMGYIAPVQAVQEFKVVTNPYDAAYGRAQGGVIDMTLKSGTNILHGSAYEFARRTWLDSNSWVNNFNNNAKPQHKRDQYGLELDGPVIIPKLYSGRDKTFFLMQFENWNEIYPSVALDTIPEPQWLTGDFNDLSYYDASTATRQPITIYDPLTLQKNASGTLVRAAFPGNIIPKDRLSPLAVQLLSYYPTSPNAKPGPTQTSYTDNYVSQNPVTDKYRNALIKIDQNISTRDRVTLRYGYWERAEYQDQNGIPGIGANGEYPHGERVHTFAPEWLHTFAPNLLFDYKASIIVRGNILNSGPLNYDLSKLGLSSSFISSLGVFGHSLPNMNPNEFTSIGNSGGEFTVGNSLAMMPGVTYTRGKHTIHAGLDWRILQSSWRDIEGGTSFSADRTWTQSNWESGDSASGNSIASFLLGTASSGSVQINPLAYYSQHYYAPYVQDDWKILPNLTLNIGFRYDLNGAIVERHNRVDYQFNTSVVNPVAYQVSSTYLNGPLKGGMEFVGVNGNPRAYNAVAKTNLQPRLGFSYSMRSTTVFHGGFGVIFKNPNPGPNQLGFSSTTQYDASNDGGQTPTQNLGVGGVAPSPFPVVVKPTGSSLGYLTGMGQGLWYLNPFFRVPKTYTYSVGIEQRFFRDDIVELNYVGTRTHHLDSSDNINHPSAASHAQCNVELGGDPSICDSATGAYVTNPFQNVPAFQGSNYYTQPTIQALNFTRPFPEFGDITEYDVNDGKTWYNALQLTASHRMSKSLMMHGTWTWSKTMDAGGFTDTIYRIASRHLDGGDMAHRVTVSGLWALPVGRGQAFVGNANRYVDAAVGGWELSSLFSWQTGSPLSLNGGTDYSGHTSIKKRESASTIRGVNTSCVAQWKLDSTTGNWALTSIGSGSGCNGAYNFVVVPSYGISPNVDYTGVRNPGWTDLDASLAKSFQIVERLHAQLRIDAFNLPNHPAWASNYDNSPTDGSFGTIVKSSAGQSNLPRNGQLSIKLIW